MWIWRTPIALSKIIVLTDWIHNIGGFSKWEILTFISKSRKILQKRRGKSIFLRKEIETVFIDSKISGVSEISNFLKFLGFCFIFCVWVINKTKTHQKKKEEQSRIRIIQANYLISRWTGLLIEPVLALFSKPCC